MTALVFEIKIEDRPLDAARREEWMESTGPFGVVYLGDYEVWVTPDPVPWQRWDETGHGQAAEEFAQALKEALS